MSDRIAPVAKKRLEQESVPIKGKLRELATAAGFKRLDPLSDRTGITAPQLSRWFRGEQLWRLRLHLPALEEVLGASVHGLALEFAAAEQKAEALFDSFASKVRRHWGEILTERAQDRESRLTAPGRREVEEIACRLGWDLDEAPLTDDELTKILGIIRKPRGWFRS